MMEDDKACKEQVKNMVDEVVLFHYGGV